MMTAECKFQRLFRLVAYLIDGTLAISNANIELSPSSSGDQRVQVVMNESTSIATNTYADVTNRIIILD